MKKILFSVAILLLSLAFTSSCAPKKEVAVQLYSMRTLIGNAEKYAQNHEEVLSALAEIGYTAVEAANYGDGKFYGVSPEEFKADVDAAGLKVLSSHCNRKLTAEEYASKDLTAALAWWDECLAAHKAAGMKYVVVPQSPVPDTLEKLQLYCEYLNAIGKKCTEQGMIFGYHNHAHEFQKVEDQVMLDYMLENTDPEHVFFQLDVYWSMMGKAAAVDYFKKYPGRFTVLHIKDRREIGQSGMVGFDAIFRNVETAGTKAIVVEAEKFSTDDWKSCMALSRSYLDNFPQLYICE